MELVAVDPLIAVVSSLIASYKKVTDFRRRGSESLSSFVSRFRGLTADHRLHVRLSVSSQVSKILAIKLLNNANLSDETLTNAKLQLIALAQSREEETPRSATTINEETLKKLEDVRSKLQQFPLEPPLRLLRSDNSKVLKLKILASPRKVERFSDALDKVIEEVYTAPTESSSVGELLIGTTPRCRLNLYDAVTVIRNLSFNGQNGSQMYTKAEIDNIVCQQVQFAMLALSKNQVHTSPRPDSKKQVQSGRSSQQQSRKKRYNSE